MIENLEENKKKLRVNLTVAIVSVLNQLPKNVFNTEFPKIIQNIIV